jgi:hypothetical protein
MWRTSGYATSNQNRIDKMGQSGFLFLLTKVNKRGIVEAKKDRGGEWIKIQSNT